MIGVCMFVSYITHTPLPLKNQCHVRAGILTYCYTSTKLSRPGY